MQTLRHIKPIRTVGQMASGLKKWRLTHEEKKSEPRMIERHGYRQVPNQNSLFLSKCLIVADDTQV